MFLRFSLSNRQTVIVITSQSGDVYIATTFVEAWSNLSRAYGEKIPDKSFNAARALRELCEKHNLTLQEI